MSIENIRIGKLLKKAGEKMGRAGLAERAIAIAKEMVEDGSYKRAIEGAGQLKALSQACGFDSYWSEKRDIGFYREVHCFSEDLAKHPSGSEGR